MNCNKLKNNHYFDTLDQDFCNCGTEAIDQRFVESVLALQEFKKDNKIVSSSKPKQARY